MIERTDFKDERAELAQRLNETALLWGVRIPESTRDALLAYGNLLLEWGQRINVTGAKSLVELVQEHYPDAFALASRLGDLPVTVIDVGAGGGLPAIPLALLAPSARIEMFEPIAKKVAFLRTAVRELGLGGRVRVEARRIVPGSAAAVFDAAVSRATFQPADWLALGHQLVHAKGRVFALTSREIDVWPPQLELAHAQRYLNGRRWLIELQRST